MAEVLYTRRAAKGLRRAPADVSRRIQEAFRRLAEGREPRPDVRRLEGRPGYRLRVGSWRAIFRVREDGVIEVLDVGPRGSIYR